MGKAAAACGISCLGSRVSEKEGKTLNFAQRHNLEIQQIGTEEVTRRCSGIFTELEPAMGCAIYIE